ncbi:hypothetical protein SAY87_027190 [Trapa incisa]|uniref:START domain-containing protein n=1 Tax=Trapa incisa TaxID=236973 RepID=A0AAN7GMY6_9MYRT|nr:hypothetical protein SAY87_027190 [Trapa incisa]
MALVESLHLTIERPTMLGLVSVLLPVWVAFIVGAAIGWLWRPKLWAKKPGKVSCVLKNPASLILPSSPTPRTPTSPLKGFSSAPCLNSLDLLGPDSGPSVLDGKFEKKPPPCVSEESSRKPSLLTEEDLKKPCELIQMKDGGPTWIHMLDRSSRRMSYRAWRRDPKIGPPQYRTRTVFENATPEMVRDFFWDDDFRPKWDDMLAYSTTIDECISTGNTVVHWIRKFPFFCSDREYIIGRRIWEWGRSYYCVTKGVSAPIPRQEKPKRVDLYFSSWFIRAVESRKNDGQLTACVVLLFHYEDVGLPYEIAKLGVSYGMCGAVKKVEPGLRAYQKARLLGEPISRPAYMAHINKKVNPELVPDHKPDPDPPQNNKAAIASKPPSGYSFPKILLVGSGVMIMLACGLNRGLLSGVMGLSARRLGDMRKKIRRARNDTTTKIPSHKF